MKPLNFGSCVEGAAHHPDHRAFFLFWRQSVPCHDGLLQRGAAVRIKRLTEHPFDHLAYSYKPSIG